MILFECVGQLIELQVIIKKIMYIGNIYNIYYNHLQLIEI